MEVEGLLWGGGRRVVGDGRSLARRRGEKQAILAVSYARRPEGLMGAVNRTGQRELTSIARVLTSPRRLSGNRRHFSMHAPRAIRA